MAPTNKVWSSGVARFSFPNSPAVPSGQKRQCFLFLRCIIYFLSTLWAPAICLITAERLSWQRQGLLARPWPKRTVRVGSPVLHENPGFGKAQGAQWGVEVPALGGGWLPNLLPHPSASSLPEWSTLSEQQPHEHTYTCVEIQTWIPTELHWACLNTQHNVNTHTNAVHLYMRHLPPTFCLAGGLRIFLKDKITEVLFFFSR